MMIGQRRPPWLDAGIHENPMTVAAPQITMPVAAAKPKFLGQGGVGRSIAGALGDYLLQMNGMRPIYAPLRAEQSAFERGEQQYQRRRMDDREDWQWKEQNQQRAPSEFDRMMDAAGVPADQRPGMYRQALERKINPPRTIVMADGTVMELPGGASPFPAVPPAPIGPLTPIGGGAGPQTPPTFPYYR